MDNSVSDGTAPASPATIDWDSASSHLIELQQNVLKARGVVAMAIRSDELPQAGDTENALRAAYAILDDLFERMDPLLFAREAREPRHE